MDGIIYLLQVTACTAVFYLFYYLFLNKLTFFVTNRWYLLATVVLSFLIPLIKLPISEPHAYTGVVQQVVYTYSPQQFVPVAIQPNVAKPTPINWGNVLKLAYLIAVAGLSLQLLVTLAAFFKRLKGKRVTKLGNVHILSSNEKITNGSFLNYIFLNDKELSADEIQQIIAHEMLHVKLYHSVDRIIVKLAQIVLWFNPFIYLYARSVEENHEFEVDRAVAGNTDKHNYANLLLHLSVAGQGMLYHNFSKVPLKKRITMLFNQPSTNMKKIVYVLVVPVVLISCLAFAKLKNKDDDKQYSVIEGVDKLGNNPVVLINGKEYKKDILFTISKACITATGIWEPDAKIIKHGVAIKDGYVEIKTRDGKITYMTPLEKENLIKERVIPQTQFYARVHLKNEDGSNYDKVIIHLPKTGLVSSQLKPDGKAGFLIDRKFYNEAEIQKLSPAIINNLSGSYGVGPAGDNFPDAPATGYESVFSFKTNKFEDSKTIVTPAKNDDIKGANSPAAKLHDLFARIEIKKKTGGSFDKMKLINHAGSSAETDIPHNGKVGIFLDHDLYTEEAFNKLSAEVKTQVFASTSVGVADATSFPLLRKRGYTADLNGYAAVFQVDYKKTYIHDFMQSRIDTTIRIKRQKDSRKVAVVNSKHTPEKSGETNDDKTKQAAAITPLSAAASGQAIKLAATDSVYHGKSGMDTFIGNAHMVRGDMELNASYIRMNESKSFIFASGKLDPKTNKYAGKPVLKIGKDGKLYTPDSLMLYKDVAIMWNGDKRSYAHINIK